MSCLFYLLNRFGLSEFVDLDVVWQLKSSGKSTKQALMCLGIEECLASKIVVEWTRLIESPYWLQLDRTHDFVFDLLEFLEGKEIYLLTARKNPYWLRHELRRLKITKYFSEVYVVSPENVTEEKAGQLRHCKADIFIGDTVSDALAAQKANVEFVGVNWGQHNERHLSESGCGHVIGDPRSLKEIISE